VLVDSFQVKNTGEVPVIITAKSIFFPPVTVPPGKTSERITASTVYSIQVELLPRPVPEVQVSFSQEGFLDARVLHEHSVKVDIIVHFDLHKGDFVLPSRPTQSAHYF
jgi:hypothetical protein